MPIRSVALELTSRCNLRCQHCYNAWRDQDDAAAPVDLPLQVLLDLVDRLADQAPLERVSLSGGEPLLRADLLAVVRHARQRGLDVTMISNGTLVTEAAARGLADAGLRWVQVTLSGADPATHDARCGAGSFAAVERGVAALLGAGIGVSGSYLCTAANADQAAAVVGRFQALGVSRIAFNRFNPSGAALAAARRLLPTRTQVLEALGQVEPLAATGAVSVTCTMPIPSCVVDEAAFPHVGFGVCAAGLECGEPTVGSDGSLRICALQRRSLGNVRETPLAALLDGEAARAFRRAIPDFCAPCPQAATCLGGCGAAAEWAFGSAAELDPFVAQHVMPGYNQRLDRNAR